MKSRNRLATAALLALTTLPYSALSKADGDVSAASFAAYCRGPLPASRQSRFDRQLAAAEQALADGRIEQAELAIGEAYSAAYRGGADSDAAVKCLGRATAERWHEARLELKRQQAADRGNTDLYVVAADSGTRELVRAVTGQPAVRFRGSVNWLREIVRRLEAERDYGAFLVSGEQAVLDACRGALPELQAWAHRAMQAALEAEREAFTQTARTQDRQLMDNANQMAAAVMGTDLALVTDPEVRLMEQRIDASMGQLQLARTRDLDPPDDIRSAAWSKRAAERGDTVYGKAGDDNISYSGRDALYARASRYYDFGGWTEKRERADAAREAIRPQLEAEQAQRETELEKAQAAMQERAEAARRAADEMMKSEEEKQDFRREADAMESELGF